MISGNELKIKLSDHFDYKRLVRFVTPTVFMLIVTSIYGIVDGFFVSNFIGKDAFAGVNLVMPMLMALGALGFMIGTGGSALISKTLGEGKKDKANTYFTTLLVVTVIGGIILTVIGFLALDPFVRLLGADESILKECMLYGQTVMICLTFYMLQNSFQSFLVVAEKPSMGLMISIVTGIMNIVLDFIFIYYFKWGIQGAALATTLSIIIGAIVPIVYFLRPNTSALKITKPHFEYKMLVKVCTNGSSEMVTNLSASFIGMLFNYQLLHFAGANGVAAYGVIMYVNIIFMSFFFGYSIGVTPVIGYNYGAQNKEELRSLLKKSLILTTYVSVFMCILSIVLAKPLGMLFVGYDQTLLDMTIHGMKVYALSFLVCGFNIFFTSLFTALNNGVISATLSVVRILVFQILMVFILPLFLGLDGIWLSVFVAEILAVVVGIVFVVMKNKTYHYLPERNEVVEES